MIEQGRQHVMLQSKVNDAREQLPVQLRAPAMDKKVIIRPPHTELFNPDGTPNSQVHLRGPGVTHNPDTGVSILFFEGIRPFVKHPTHGHRRRSAVYGARSKDAWDTAEFFDPHDPHITDRTRALPVFESIAPEDVSLHGQQDPRLTHFGKGSAHETYVAVANTTNIVKKLRGLEAIDRDPDQILGGGAAPEVYLMSDAGDPATYKALGPLGPDEHFKNVVLLPETITVDGEPHVFFFGRRFPDIQAFTIPLADINKFFYSKTYRNRYWGEHLATDYIQENTVLQPLFDWEGRNEEQGINGQIAGGASPIKVSIKDEITHQDKNAWLFIYNAAPAFDKDNNGIGRVVGAALLDYHDPRIVLSRSPMPIIWPTEGKEITGGAYENVTFATGAYIETNNTLRILYTAGDSEIAMASCPAAEMVAYLSKFDKNGNVATN